MESYRGYVTCPYCQIKKQQVDLQPEYPGMMEPGQMMGSREMMEPGRMPGSREMMESGRMPGSREMMEPGNLGYPEMNRPDMRPGYGGPVPYYKSFDYPQIFLEEQENEKDMQRLKEMYPAAAKDILPYVEDECDKMEYDGSIMFDERPDQIMLGLIRDGIYDQVKGQYDLPEEQDTDELFAMNRETRRRYPPKKNWLNDMIEVMLLQEMHRRRCRHRNCRRWY